MERKFLVLLLGLLPTCLIWSQDNGTIRTIGDLNMDDQLTFDNRYSGVKGSPYIFADFQKAWLFTNQKPPLEVAGLNFDRYSRELCYKSSSAEPAIQLNKYLIDSFYVVHSEDTLRFQRINLDSNGESLYMECLYSGRTRLYLDYGKKFNEADYVDPYSADRRYDEFQDMPVFYLQFKQGDELYPIKKNKKQFSSLFEKHSDQVAAYLKAERISLKNRDDLITVLEYYDRILN